MLRKNTLIATVVWTGALAYAQQPNFSPLDPGNIWIYQCTGACGGQATVTVSVGRMQAFNGTDYMQIQGWFGHDYWLREDSNGSVWAYDQNAQQESLWYAFGTPVGGNYNESIPSACCGLATLTSTSAAYAGPLGRYDTALEIDYPGASLAGVYRELFLAFVGLVSRREATEGAQERAYDLIYCRDGVPRIVAS